MKHSALPTPRAASLSPPERHFLRVLRLWREGPAGQEAAWNGLCRELGGTERARACLRALETLLGLLDRHGWRALDVAAPGTAEIGPDEAALARFVGLAAEQDREAAMAHGLFLVAPGGILPLLRAAERAGLPFLCADCRARVLGRTG